MRGLLNSATLSHMNRSELEQDLNRECVRLWDVFCELYPQLCKFNPPKVILNGRYTKRAGCCEVENNLIQLGYKFFPKHRHNMYRVILPHEIAHQVDYNLHGLPARWHGKTWQNIMIKYGLPADTYHQMEI